MNAFANDLVEGFSKTPKKLSSKYFYDKRGSELFSEIMHQEEYYLTNCEFEIFQTYQQELLTIFQKDKSPFHLIELGAGDGLKTKILLNHFVEQKAAFEFTAIDISKSAIDGLVGDLHQQFPSLKVNGIQNTYFQALDILQKTTVRKVILFLGSNIGNFTLNEATELLQELQKHLHPGDLLLMGIDLKKYPDIILAAYNDKNGVTTAFNKNLLHRINNEFEGDIEVDSFLHYPTYNPLTGDTKSYLVATKDQTINLKKLNQSFTFNAWEAIDVELSKKYSISEVDVLCNQAGFQLVQHFFDAQHYFVDTIWEKKGSK